MHANCAQAEKRTKNRSWSLSHTASHQDLAENWSGGFPTSILDRSGSLLGTLWRVLGAALDMPPFQYVKLIALLGRWAQRQCLQLAFCLAFSFLLPLPLVLALALAWALAWLWPWLWLCKGKAKASHRQRQRQRQRQYY